MTKAELVNEIAINTGYDKRTLAVVVDGVMNTIKSSLSKGQPVYLRGFGSFILKTRKAKVARNIRAKTSVSVPEHSIAYFIPAKEMKEVTYAAPKMVKKAK